MAELLLLAAHLADRGRLADAVDADEEPDVGRSLARGAASGPGRRAGPSAGPSARRGPGPAPAGPRPRARVRRSSSSVVDSSTPTSARMSASSSCSHVSSSMPRERIGAEVAGEEAPRLAQPVAEGGLDQRWRFEQLLQLRVEVERLDRPRGATSSSVGASTAGGVLRRHLAGAWSAPARWRVRPVRPGHGSRSIAAGQGHGAGRQPDDDQHEEDDDDHELHRRVSLGGPGRPGGRRPRRRAPRRPGAAPRRARPARRRRRVERRRRLAAAAIGRWRGPRDALTGGQRPWVPSVAVMVMSSPARCTSSSTLSPGRCWRICACSSM